MKERGDDMNTSLDMPFDLVHTYRMKKDQNTFIRVEGKGNQNMKKQSRSTVKGVITAAILSAAVLSGCSSERLEDQLAYRQVGINNMDIGNYEDAVTAFDSALALCTGQIGDTEIDICYYKAAAQYAAGNTQAALETYQTLLDYDSKDAYSYYLRGCLLLQNGENDQAVSDFANAVKYRSEDYELYVRIYENLSAYNLTAEGEEYLNKAFDIKGDDAENLAWRGKIYFLLGQYENALAELTAALEKESIDANLTIAQVYEAQGDFAQAESYYQAYVAAGTADSEAMNALAEIEMQKGNYLAALDYIRQGLAMDYVPNKKALMQNEIIASEYTGDFANAWTVIQEYTALYPEDANAQREYIFLKNRQNGTEETGEVIPAEISTE